MKKLVLVVVAVFMFINLSAQQAQKVTRKSSHQYEMVKHHDNGQIAQIGSFNKEGKLHGVWTQYDREGNILTQGVYNNGMKVGKWLFWNDNQLKEVDFKNNKLVKYTEWSKTEYLATH